MNYSEGGGVGERNVLMDKNSINGFLSIYN